MINKLFGLTTAISLLAAFNANAAVQLVPSSTTVNVNDSFVVNVQASALTNIDSASVKFSYDQNIVRLDAITLDGAAFCDLVIRDAVADDGTVEGIFALAHQPAGDPCPALSGDFTAFQIQMTALTVGNASLSMTQDATGFGWTSEDNPGVVVADTTASPLVIAVAAAVPDTDGDLVLDDVDNCTLVPNPIQRDTDSDGYGNKCDGDLNQTGNVDVLDIGVFKTVINSSNYIADFDNDNDVDIVDLGYFKNNLFNKPLGPSCCGINLP